MASVSPPGPADQQEQEQVETLEFEPHDEASELSSIEADEHETKGASTFVQQTTEIISSAKALLASRITRFIGTVVVAAVLLAMIAFNLPFSGGSDGTNQLRPDTPLTSNVPPNGISQHSQDNEAEQESLSNNTGAVDSIAPGITQSVSLDTILQTQPGFVDKIAKAQAGTVVATKSPGKPPGQSEASEELKAMPQSVQSATKPQARYPLATITFQITSQKKPIEASVFVSDKFRGKSDINGRFVIENVEPNRIYTAKVSREGFSTVTKRFKATSQPTVLSFDISPEKDLYGTLVLDIHPTADSIFIDGNQYRGQPPLQLALSAGEHHIRVVNNGLGKTWEQVVDLRNGQIVRLKHNFPQADLGKVAVSLKNSGEVGFAYVYVDGKLWHGKPNTTPVELDLPVGSHTLEVRREGFSAIPRDITVIVNKEETRNISFTLTKNP